MPQSIPETLESRILFAALPPSAEETYVVELLNRARANPALEALRYGINLNEGLATGAITTTPKQPLAMNGFLLDSSYVHALYLQPAGLVTVVGANGSLPMARMITSGYVFSVNGSGVETVQELQIGNSTPPKQVQIDQLHANLFTDVMSNIRQDRIFLMTDQYKEIGPALVSGLFGGGGAQSGNPPGIAEVLDYAVSPGNSAGDAFLCGVAYNDADGDGFYDVGEGLGNVNVSARRLSDNAIFRTTTYGALFYNDSAGAPSGGYTLRLQPGTYDVIATGGGLGNVQVQYPAVVIGARNVKRDFTPQQQTSPPSPPPTGGGVIPPGTPNPVTNRGDLRGKVFVDQNGNGKRDRDVDTSVIKGIKVYVDLNKNNNRDSDEPFGVVLANGTWNIVGLFSGIKRVSLEPPIGYRISVPDQGFRDVVLSAGRLKTVKAFLVTPRTIIAGTVFRDDNGNGVFDTNVEKGRSGWRVFLDLNNDGVWQRETEPSRRTDSQGKYAFRDLVASTYTIRVIPRVGYLQTKPANNGFYVVQLPVTGLSALDNDFGEKLLG
jgi:hypothetical protein